MSRAAIREGVDLIQRAATTLAASPAGSDVDAAADLRRAVGDLSDRAEQHIRSGSIGSALASAFEVLTAAGADVDRMDRVRAAVAVAAPASRPAIALRGAIVQMALIGMATALRAAAFRSREDVQAMVGRVNAAFSPAIDDAADAGQNGVYRDLVALHAAVTRDLMQRGRPLPRMVPYSFPRRLPTLAISQRLYGASDRANDLAAENKVVHPLFAPAAGRALSA